MSTNPNRPATPRTTSCRALAPDVDRPDLPHGTYVCTRPAGHLGDHVALSCGVELHRWPATTATCDRCGWTTVPDHHWTTEPHGVLCGPCSLGYSPEAVARLSRVGTAVARGVIS